jgi:hypothetical protein
MLLQHRVLVLQLPVCLQVNVHPLVSPQQLLAVLLLLPPPFPVQLLLLPLYPLLLL